jgi:putative membrane protein
VRREDRYAKGCLAVLAVWWIAWGVAPTDRHIWFAENVLVFVGLPLTIYAHLRVGFSRPALTLLTLYFAVHTVGTHYTYTNVPVGEWLKERFDYQRNHYDRIVHLLFGFLLALPVRELFTRGLRIGGALAFWLPLSVIMAGCCLYEVLEWWFAIYTDSTAQLAFVGAQGDLWDAQKDMALATGGAILVLLGATLARGEETREPAASRSRRT